MPPPVPGTARLVVTQLARIDPHVRPTITYTAATDPNNLLGRPNGYASKTAFRDSLVPRTYGADRSLGSVDVGGSVEYYSTSAGARRRADYIQGLQARSPMLGTEYDYLDGAALLRVSGGLTPAQAGKLKAEFSRVMGRQAEGPVTAP